MCIYSANLNKSMRRWVFAIIIALAGLAIRSNIQVPYINMGSNVFIGGIGYENSIFSKELPPIVYKKLNEEFILKFPDSLSSPDKNLFEISVTQMINKNSETKMFKVRRDQDIWNQHGRAKKTRPKMMQIGPNMLSNGVTPTQT